MCVKTKPSSLGSAFHFVDGKGQVLKYHIWDYKTLKSLLTVPSFDNSYPFYPCLLYIWYINSHVIADFPFIILL